MAESSPAARTLSPEVVLVPVKDFAMAKGRLASVLGPTRRAELARRLATGVVQAAAGLPVVVVCDDETIADWALSVGARPLMVEVPGLNPAVSAAVDRLTNEGVERVSVAHGDLARPEGLLEATGGAEVVIVPDRHGEGTNVLTFPTGVGFTVSYGAGSFARHRAEADRLGLSVRVVHDSPLGWDVDLPDDLPPEHTEHP